MKDSTIIVCKDEESYLRLFDGDIYAIGTMDNQDILTHVNTKGFEYLIDNGYIKEIDCHEYGHAGTICTDKKHQEFVRQYGIQITIINRHE